MLTPRWCGVGGIITGYAILTTIPQTSHLTLPDTLESLLLSLLLSLLHTVWTDSTPPPPPHVPTPSKLVTLAPTAALLAASAAPLFLLAKVSALSSTLTLGVPHNVSHLALSAAGACVGGLAASGLCRALSGREEGEERGGDDVREVEDGRRDWDLDAVDDDRRPEHHRRLDGGNGVRVEGRSGPGIAPGSPPPIASGRGDRGGRDDGGGGGSRWKEYLNPFSWFGSSGGGGTGGRGDEDEGSYYSYEDCTTTGFLTAVQSPSEELQSSEIG